jgi:hypothetical protein
MSRRVTLPGADELFRKTTLAAVPAVDSTEVATEETTSSVTKPTKTKGVRTTARRKPSSIERAPSGREKHDEKITVYLSPDELFDLEQARLLLRGDLGLAVDRGRIVREALSIVIADLESKGDQSIIARRLRGR